jgi:hypothetical protein
VIDALFKLPLAEFTAARNALAASLKAAGRADEAASVKALTKPPLSAWAVNQLYWHHRKPFDHLMAVGERLRKEQTLELTRQGERDKGEGGRGKGEEGRGKGEASPGKGDLRAMLEARNSALADLAKRAAALLREAGHPASPDVMRRITTTLEALATYGNQPGVPAAGQLMADVDPPGFEVLSALVPRSNGKRGTRGEPSRVIPFRPSARATPAKKLSPAARQQQEEKERQAQRKAAMAAVRDAERALREARKAVAHSQAALRKAAAHAKITEKAKAELEKQFEKASADADAARQEARRVASAAEDAAQSLQDAENQVQTLKSKVERNS